MMFDFLQPLSDDLVIDIHRVSNQALGKKVILHNHQETPVLEEDTIAIIGVLDNRGLNSVNTLEDLDEIRLQFYNLFPGNWNTNIYDLGDIIAGSTIEDTYYVVKTVCAELIKKRIIPIIIGGSQDISYAMYRAYDNLDQMVNLVAVDGKFDFENGQNSELADSYLSKMIVDEPNNLFNYCNIGYQTYYNSQEEIDLIEKLYFDAYRLGEVSHNTTIAEPVFRDADIVSIDMRSVKSSASGNKKPFVPNGFNGKEICILARYSGISDKVSSFGVFNHNNSKEESVLISQVIWYFIEGYHYRSKEYPIGTRENFIKYIVPIEDEELVFYKSNYSERWWIEIPFTNSSNKLKRNTLLPCSNEDYILATQQEIPNRWWKAQRKNSI
ncbi:formimidoylglutamase [uncultured Flavobacterium sp.]|mgnify:CR=1 FL=1|uniref:formimidoylglutamase n=1 Tax=uncultured Flavobacterium sp. TaxID=165435 RepID=UPI0030EDEE6A|tara:strand:- start:51525 stop:52673 length:1149 start_codon:yes stop_codon:yes gene_type:complete